MIPSLCSHGQKNFLAELIEITKSKKQKREAIASVEIDNRLTDLFNSRKAGATATEAEEPDFVAEEVRNEAPVTEVLSWFSQFQTAVGAPVEKRLQGAPETSSSDIVAYFTVDRSTVKPFWATENTKKTIATWMNAKSALAKDCQKQRKAAIRKIIRH